MIGAIAFGLAILLALGALAGALLCLWAQRKNPTTALPLAGVEGILFLTTVVCSVVVLVGVY